VTSALLAFTREHAQLEEVRGSVHIGGGPGFGSPAGPEKFFFRHVLKLGGGHSGCQGQPVLPEPRTGLTQAAPQAPWWQSRRPVAIMPVAAARAARVAGHSTAAMVYNSRPGLWAKAPAATEHGIVSGGPCLGERARCYLQSKRVVHVAKQAATTTSRTSELPIGDFIHLEWPRPTWLALAPSCASPPGAGARAPGASPFVAGIALSGFWPHTLFDSRFNQAQLASAPVNHSPSVQGRQRGVAVAPDRDVNKLAPRP
jgi:hypothetical protein